MRRWRLPLTNIWGVAIAAVAALLKLLEFAFDRDDILIRTKLFALVVTRSARIDGHIRRQSAKRTRARDVDVAGRAFQHVLAFATFVRKLH